VTEDVTSGAPDDGRLRALMVRYQAGHLEGFDELYALVSPTVRRFLRGRVGDAARVEDLVQEVFLRLHQARHTYDPRYPLMPWLVAIARHTWLMDIRARSRRPQPNVALDDRHMTPVTSGADRISHRDELRQALAQLTPAGRAPVVMHHVWGYSFAEIATRTGVNQAVAKLRSSRAMRVLRQALQSSRRREER
jgi:RNA polymerase sigma factor (sigma-70 family)